MTTKTTTSKKTKQRKLVVPDSVAERFLQSADDTDLHVLETLARLSALRHEDGTNAHYIRMFSDIVTGYLIGIDDMLMEQGL